jgi:hypothetical protein
MNNAKTTNFNKLSKQQKRIAVAKDALQQLLKGKFRPYMGEWVTTSFRNARKYSGRQLCDVMDEIGCRCCQLGALFLSDVRFRNDFKVVNRVNAQIAGYGPNGLNEINRLADYFSEDQLRLIEIAFERGGGLYVPHDYEYSAVDFGKKYRSAKGRMIGILTNVINNDGVFVPVLPAKLNFNKVKRYNITYLKEGRELNYEISRPIEQTATHFTSYAYGRGLRTFKKGLVTSMK